MNIIMSGIDHTIADVARRECFALPSSRQRLLLEQAGAREGILGAAVLSTCNRTEIYLSLTDGVQLDPFELISPEGAEHYTYSGRDCFEHLAKMTCGAESRIFGEDQILSQVKKAISFARECHAADNVLEVLFREAVSAAKKVKTQLHFSHGDDSAAGAALQVLRAYEGISSVLVIGNGEIGRMAAQILCENGYAVTMTLRQYKHAAVSIPSGVSVIDYEKRYEALGRFDAVVSATSSPHCTLEAQRLEGLPAVPRVLIDLAMPRDIEPAIAERFGVEVYDIDRVSDRLEREENRRACVESMMPLIAEAYESFLKWADGRERLWSVPPRTHFPLFVECTGQKVLVLGGGRIASRRIMTLLKFNFSVTVVAPEARDEILSLAGAGRIQYLERKFEDGDAADAFLLIAATNQRAVNHRAAVIARHLGIYCSIADCREECTFFFPAVAENDDVTVGVCGSGRAHHRVVEAAKKIREVLHG